ncbi:MAG: glycosyltransferase [Candidatus Helarchaeota archaeon]
MIKKDWPFITIAMPVRNEEAFIEDTLNQLLQQDYPADRFEIIVADGESTDRTREIVQKVAEKYPQVRLMNNPGRLPSSGRNVGFKNGKGDFFLVIDGHCVIPTDQLLKNVADLFVRTGVECLGRPQPFVTPDEPNWQRAIAIARSSSLGHSASSYIHANEEGYVSPVSMGCAYRKDVCQKIGYVDESFDACEDVEFNYRVEKAGFKTYFSSKIAVHYFPRESLAGLWKQLNRYGIGRAKFLLKHPETFSWEILLPIFFVLGFLLGPLFGFLHLVFWWLYLGGVSAYLLLLIAYSIRLRTTEPWHFVVKLVLVFITTHFAIGTGIIRGLWREFKRKTFSK